MITLKDYHIHTTFSDGKNTPREIIEYAIKKGVDTVGFTDHSFAPFDNGCIKEDKIDEYINEISALKKEYSGRINVLCGIEQDYCSCGDVSRYDYVIGSVHYLKVLGEYIPIDISVDIVKNAVNKYFGGKVYGFLEEYFNVVSLVVEKTKCDIIGHFDLVSKFNEKTPFFDENDVGYKELWKNALNKLLSTGKTFEINTGAMARGLKSNPYPNAEMIDYIKAGGGKFVLSSDAHKKENVCYCFDKIKITE